MGTIPAPHHLTDTSSLGDYLRDALTSHRVISLLKRFLPLVSVGDGCWEWIGFKRSNGYGAFWLDGRSQTAHRVSYELFVGAIPEGLTIDHLCRNHPCVRPDHLGGQQSRKRSA